MRRAAGPAAVWPPPPRARSPRRPVPPRLSLGSRSARSSVLAREDLHAQLVRADRVGAPRLEPLYARLLEAQARDALLVGRLPADLGAGDGLAVLSVLDLHRVALAGAYLAKAAQQEDVLLAEHVVGPQDLLAALHLELAAAHLQRLSVHRVAPELRACLRVRSDPADEEVLEARVEAAGPAEAGLGRRGVECARDRRAGRGVGAAVGAVALVWAGVVARDRVSVGGHGAFEDRLLGALDADVDLGRRREGGCAREHGCEDREGPDAGLHVLEPPLPRGIRGCRPEAGLLASGCSRLAAPSQGDDVAPVAFVRLAHPVTVAGARPPRPRAPPPPPPSRAP